MPSLAPFKGVPACGRAPRRGMRCCAAAPAGRRGTERRERRGRAVGRGNPRESRACIARMNHEAAGVDMALARLQPAAPAAKRSGGAHGDRERESGGPTRHSLPLRHALVGAG
jgi:hypothetical protein